MQSSSMELGRYSFTHACHCGEVCPQSHQQWLLVSTIRELGSPTLSGLLSELFSSGQFWTVPGITVLGGAQPLLNKQNRSEESLQFSRHFFHKGCGKTQHNSQWPQSKNSPSIQGDDWMKKLCYICTMEEHSAMRKDEIMQPMWVDQSIFPSKVSQTREIQNDVSHMWVIKKQST